MITSVLTVIVLTTVIGISALLYLLPLLVGWARRVPDLGVIAVIDVLLGWTFVGWIMALAMALRSVPAASPVVQVVQNVPPAPPQPPFPHPQGAGWAGPPGPPPSRPDDPPPLALPPVPWLVEGSGSVPARPGRPDDVPGSSPEGAAHGY